MKNVEVKMKKCVCKVPAWLSPTGEEIAIGTVLEYAKRIFRNGEWDLILSNGEKVPDMFFK